MGTRFSPDLQQWATIFFGRWLGRWAFGAAAADWPKAATHTTVSVGIAHPNGERTFLTSQGHLSVHGPRADATWPAAEACRQGRRGAFSAGGSLSPRLIDSYEESDRCVWWIAVFEVALDNGVGHRAAGAKGSGRRVAGLGFRACDPCPAERNRKLFVFPARPRFAAAAQWDCLFAPKTWWPRVVVKRGGRWGRAPGRPARPSMFPAPHGRGRRQPSVPAMSSTARLILQARLPGPRPEGRRRPREWPLPRPFYRYTIAPGAIRPPVPSGRLGRRPSL